MLPTGQKRQNESLDQDVDSDDSETKPTKRNGRRKIKIEYIEDKNRRHITFSKRKAGIMKKAYELSTLTGTQVLLLVVSETGLVYTFTTTKLQPIVTKPEGKNLIQTCLNTPDPNVQDIPENNSNTSSTTNKLPENNVTSPQSTSATSPMMQPPTGAVAAPIPSTQPSTNNNNNAYSQPTMPPQMPPYNNQQRYPGTYGAPQPSQPYPPQQQQPYGQPFYQQQGYQQQPQQQQQGGYWNNNGGQPNTTSPTQRPNVKQEQQQQS